MSKEPEADMPLSYYVGLLADSQERLSAAMGELFSTIASNGRSAVQNPATYIQTGQADKLEDRL